MFYSLSFPPPLALKHFAIISNGLTNERFLNIRLDNNVMYEDCECRKNKNNNVTLFYILSLAKSRIDKKKN